MTRDNEDSQEPPDSQRTPLAPPRLPSTEPWALEPGFGSRYERGALLGVGGMGEVSLCNDRLIEREVAMKVALRDETGDLQQRFLREARVQGQLEHPSIVPVYDMGLDPDGQLFFTMRRVRGLTLSEVFDLLRGDDPATKQQFSRRKLLGAFSAICLAVDFAHSHGVLHRDLKPSNVILGPFGEVYVLDWGLAKVMATLAATATAATTATATAAPLAGDDETRPRPLTPPSPLGLTDGSVVLGTPGFMAPEQVRGEEIDGRADVYSLGAILFELLAGQPLHPRTTSHDIRISTIAGADARTSVRCPERDVPPELEAIAVRATATERDHRFATARALHEAVERYLDGDRDLQLRRELAARYARSAEEQADRALAASDAQQRSGALREVSRALALDPQSKPAVRTLMRLLTEPAGELPPAARAERDAAARRYAQIGAYIGAVSLLTWMIYIGIAMWMGVRSVTLAAAFLATYAVTVVAFFLTGIRPHPRGRVPPAIMVVSAALIGATSLGFGPFLLPPLVALLIASAFALARDRGRRALMAAMLSLGILVPFLLERVGWLDPSYAFRDGVMVLLPRLIDFPPVITPWFLLINSIMAVAGLTLVVSRVRDQFGRVEDRLQFHAWQLRELASEEEPSAAAAAR